MNDIDFEVCRAALIALNRKLIEHGAYEWMEQREQSLDEATPHAARTTFSLLTGEQYELNEHWLDLMGTAWLVTEALPDGEPQPFKHEEQGS